MLEGIFYVYIDQNGLRGIGMVVVGGRQQVVLEAGLVAAPAAVVAGSIEVEGRQQTGRRGCEWRVWTEGPPTLGCIGLSLPDNHIMVL
jgi:hypothetical protein